MVASMLYQCKACSETESERWITKSFVILFRYLLVLKDDQRINDPERETLVDGLDAMAYSKTVYIDQLVLSYEQIFELRSKRLRDHYLL